ncbi:hypothetical protein DRN98_00860 [Methanosarcinales archaeon]|nr:MAG: hypothetical protein DRN98_00860 [Methanosarcinales archaeon]
MSGEPRFRDLIEELVSKDSLSISAIQRQLEKKGVKEHRLIVTGYLRALRDMGIVEERKVPPSKVYSLISKEEKSETDFYSYIKQEIEDLDVDAEVKLVVAVLLINTLFHRPCFRIELKRLGTSYGESEVVRKVDGSAYIRAIDQNKLAISDDEPAFECVTELLSTEVVDLMIRVLSNVVKEVVDVSGLYEKYPQKTLEFNL